MYFKRLLYSFSQLVIYLFTHKLINVKVLRKISRFFLIYGGILIFKIRIEKYGYSLQSYNFTDGSSLISENSSSIQALSSNHLYFLVFCPDQS